ncbi:hypothetical protein Bbelb_322500 [Branchiostoma belcheri]|nr:hypothetical protein Bbelb_322500 [Branchiostoma belcheri]
MFSSASAVLLQAAVSGYDERKTSRHRHKNRSSKTTAHQAAKDCTAVGDTSVKKNLTKDLTDAMEGCENSGGRPNVFIQAVENALKVFKRAGHCDRQGQKGDHRHPTL